MGGASPPPLNQRKEYQMVKVNKSDGFTTFVISSDDIRNKSEDEIKEEMKNGLKDKIKN